jgi:hypothetical protein
VTGAPDSDHDRIPDSSDKCPNTPATARPVNTVGCPLPKATTFTTTNLSNVNLNNVSSFDISNNNYGKISFGATATPYTLITTNGGSLDLDSNVSITSGSISLNSAVLTQLNKPATLTFNNIYISQVDLQILRDSLPCTGCKVVSYLNNTLVITVPGFSTYSIHNLVAPGDTIPPLVDITLPSNNSTITQGTVVTLTASSTDNVAVAGVYFAANGGVITSTLTTSPYTTTWTPSVGTYNIQAVAYDTAKNYATSNSVTLTVNAPTDLCPNIDGVQTSIPGGMIMSGGNCITPYYGGGGGGSTSYGSTGSFTPTITQLSTQPSNCPKGYVCKSNTLNTTITPPGSPITSQLTLNSKGTQVTRLKWLLSNGTQSAFTTDVLDQATLTQLQSFQCKTLYVCSGTPASTGYGGTGPRTRAALNALAGNTSHVSVVNNQIPITNNQSSNLPIFQSSIPSTFTRTLKLGSTGVDVKALQVFLNTHGFIVATSGNGSPGHETTYYGQATASAISRFQMAHALQILTPNGLTQGTGNFGPATMKVVNGMM